MKNLLAASSSVMEGKDTNSMVSSGNDNEEENFFNCRKLTVSDSDILMQYLQNNSNDIDMLMVNENLKKAFIQLNTPLPASAAVERLFSCAGLTLNSRRTRLSDKMFEDLVMLKINKNF